MLLKTEAAVVDDRLSSLLYPYVFLISPSYLIALKETYALSFYIVLSLRCSPINSYLDHALYSKNSSTHIRISNR